MRQANRANSDSCTFVGESEILRMCCQVGEDAHICVFIFALFLKLWQVSPNGSILAAVGHRTKHSNYFGVHHILRVNFFDGTIEVS